MFAYGAEQGGKHVHGLVGLRVVLGREFEQALPGSIETPLIVSAVDRFYTQYSIPHIRLHTNVNQGGALPGGVWSICYTPGMRLLLETLFWVRPCGSEL